MKLFNFNFNYSTQGRSNSQLIWVVLGRWSSIS